MRTGVVEANLVTLNETAKLSYLDDLIAQKQTGPEKGTLNAADVAFYEAEYERLTKELEAANKKLTNMLWGRRSEHVCRPDRASQVRPGG